MTRTTAGSAGRLQVHESETREPAFAQGLRLSRENRTRTQGPRAPRKAKAQNANCVGGPRRPSGRSPSLSDRDPVLESHAAIGGPW